MLKDFEDQYKWFLEKTIFGCFGTFVWYFFSWFWAPLPLPSIFTHSWRQSGVQTNFGSPSWKYLLLFFRIVFWEDTVIYLHSHTPSSHFRANPMRFETFPIERVYFLTSWPDLPGLSESTLWGFTLAAEAGVTSLAARATGRAAVQARWVWAPLE